MRERPSLSETFDSQPIAAIRRGEEVARAHAHRSVHVAQVDLLAGDPGDEERELVDRDVLAAADVDAVLEVGLHQGDDAVHHVVHVGVGAHRGPVAPDLDRAAVRGLRDLAAHRGGSLLAPAPPRPLGPVAVLEAGEADRHLVATAVGHRRALGVELLPAVLVVGQGRVGLGLVDLGLVRLHVAVDAGRRGEEVAGHAGGGRGVGHVQVDQAAVAHDLALGRVDEPHAAHVGRELVDLVEGLAVLGAHGRLAIGRVPQVDPLEVVGGGGRELGVLLVGATDPVAVLHQPPHEVAPDEAPRPAHQRRLLPPVRVAHRVPRVVVIVAGKLHAGRESCQWTLRYPRYPATPSQRPERADS